MRIDRCMWATLATSSAFRGRRRFRTTSTTSTTSTTTTTTKIRSQRRRRRRRRRRRIEEDDTDDVAWFISSPPPPSSAPFFLRPFPPPPLSSSAHRNRIQRWMQTPCHHVTWPMATMATTNCYLNATLDWEGVGGSGWEPELKDLPMKEMADGKKDARFWLQ